MAAAHLSGIVCFSLKYRLFTRCYFVVRVCFVLGEENAVQWFNQTDEQKETKIPLNNSSIRIKENNQSMVENVEA